MNDNQIGLHEMPVIPASKIMELKKVENGFIVIERFGVTRVYLDFDTMASELKAYFL